MRRALLAVFAGATLVVAAALWAYPLDGYEETGIRRVEGARLANEGLAIGGVQPPGALLTTEQVGPRLLELSDMVLPSPDPEFTAEIAALLGKHANAYGFAVLDLTRREQPRYAEHRGDYRQNVGSVGKLLAALGYFQALADAWPEDYGQRSSVLRNTIITADNFAHHGRRSVRMFDVEARVLTRRKIRDGDQASAWEYLDWMLSASSNSAASMMMRDAMLLRHFGQGYPVSEAEIEAFFRDTPERELTRLFQDTFWEPVTRLGLPLDKIRQGSFFTAGGKKNVDGGGNSYATAHTLMRMMLKMEQGKLVDEWTSRQLKRLLYVTERRTRFVASPALTDAAVYFKSGSFYKCRQEPGFQCGAYRGNVFNYMNSVAVVEQDIEDTKLLYIVIVISNVLRQNSAQDHQELGTEIHRIIQRQAKTGSE